MLAGLAGAVLLIAGAAAAAFVLLRHLSLTALVLFAPAILLLPVAALIEVFARELLALLPLAWLFGVVLSLLFADELVLRLLDGEAPKPAWRATLSARWQAFLAGTLAGAASLALPGFASGSPRAGGLMALALVAAAAGFGFLWLARYLDYGESFVARSNRVRERAQRAFDILIAVARPRWGFAVAGIALVFAVLSGFGLRTLNVAPELRADGVLLLGGGAGMAVLAASAAIRDWRAILTSLLALALSATVGLWGLALARHPLDSATAFGFVSAFAAGSLLILTAGAEAGRYGRDGDDATIAAARTLVRMGPGLFFAALALAAGLALWTVYDGPAALALALMAAFSGAGALLFQPAFAIVIERFFPRAATLAGRYRLG